MTRGILRGSYQALALAPALALHLLGALPSGVAAQEAPAISTTREVRPPDEPARRGLIAVPPAAVFALSFALAAASGRALLGMARNRSAR